MGLNYLSLIFKIKNLVFLDVVYLQYGRAAKSEPPVRPFVFVTCLDICSRFLYCELIPEGRVNSETLKKAFLRLFKYQHMPYFSILRGDKDKSLAKINNEVFAKRNMFLTVKRGPRFLTILENVIKQIEKKLSQYLLLNPKVTNYKRVLKMACDSYDKTINSAYGLRPVDANSKLYDPYLRSKMFPKEGLLPFHQFLKEQLRLQKEIRKPRTRSSKNVQERYDSWKIGDLCLVAFSPNALRRGKCVS